MSFDISKYLSPDPTTPYSHWNIFDSRLHLLRFKIPHVKTITITSITAANLPLVAQQELGSHELWWTLLYYNGLSDPIKDISIGAQIRIPNKNKLLSELETSFQKSSSIITNSFITL